MNRLQRGQWLGLNGDPLHHEIQHKEVDRDEHIAGAPVGPSQKRLIDARLFVAPELEHCEHACRGNENESQTYNGKTFLIHKWTIAANLFFTLSRHIVQGNTEVRNQAGQIVSYRVV